MRFLFGLFALILAFVLIRSLLEPVIRAIVALLAPSAPTARSAPPPPRAGELKKDPVCGTFVAPELAVTKKFNGEIVHFCSEKCLDEYARRA